MAGRIAAECLDMLIPYVVPGVATEKLDRLAREFILDHGALPACLFYSGYSPHALHLAQPRGLPRHPGRAAAARGRHRQHRRHRDRRRLARRHLAHVRRRRGAARGRAGWSTSPTRAWRAASPQVKPGARLGDIGHAIQAYVEASAAAWCATSAATASGGCSTTPPTCCTSAARGDGTGAAARHVLHRRADGEPRQVAGEAARRRLDRGHPRQVAVGPVRALGRRDRDRRRDLHRLARRPLPAADPRLTAPATPGACALVSGEPRPCAPPECVCCVGDDHVA